MSSEELAAEVKNAVELSTLDIAIAGQKLDQLAVYKGGEEFARHARAEVRRREARGVPTIEALHEVFRLVANEKL